MDLSRLRLPDQHDIGEVEHIAVGIRKKHHAGIFYRVSGAIKYLHLRWHYCLDNTDPDQQDAWIVPQIRKSRARVLQRQCIKIWEWYRQGGKIPFAFCDPGETTFGKNDGSLSLCDGATGLTCAEFVRAIFRTHGLNLIDTSYWRKRQEDIDRQEWAIEQMEGQIRQAELTGHWPDSTPTREHVEAVKQCRGQIRVRPEEVAGACLSYTVRSGPEAMCKCETAGLLVMAILKRYEERAGLGG